MATRQTDAVLHGLCRMAEAESQRTDGELLARFAAERDESAFAALLHRHGGLVYGVCRNLLRHEQDAEDAFQGTFLVLVRLAGTIREEKALASWLYRVAYRVAMKARRASARRRRREEEAARPEEDRPTGELGWRELQAMLDEELNRLPEKYRAPFVLCCLAGMGKAEAAVQLGWKEGTVSSRLAQAREVLRARLARRGVSLSAILSGLAIADSARAVVPAALLESTRQAGLAFATGAPGVAPAAAGFARAVARGFAFSRLKVPAAVVALVLAVGAALGYRSLPEPVMPDEPPAVAVVPPAPAPPEGKPAPASAPRPAGPRMTVGGSVVGPDGKPAPGARVAVVVGRQPHAGERFPFRLSMQLLGEGRADDRGQFRLTLPQTVAENYRLTAVAYAPGFAVSDHLAEPAAVVGRDHTLPVRLARGQTVRVRLTDDAGQPVKRAEVHVLGMTRGGDSSLQILFHDPPVPVPGWPAPVKTDDDGAFTLRDIGPDTLVQFQVRDERYSPGWLSFRTGKLERARPVPITLPPARILEGTITAEDSGKPLPNVTVVAETMRTGEPTGFAEARTDREGRYRLRPFPGDRVWLSVYPAPEQPYLSLRQELAWPAGGDLRRVNDFPVPRGVLIRGTVVEEGSGRAVGGAGIRYEWTFSNNPYRKALRARPGVQWDVIETRTDPDGGFYITAPLGAGTLMVKAAEPDYLPVETSSGQLLDGKRSGGTPYFPHAVLRTAFDPTSGVQTPVLKLRRGVTLKGRVVGSDGKPVASALLVCPTYVPVGWEMRGRALPVRDGRFELPGCAPGGRVNVWVYDPAKKEGALAELTVKAGTEPEVRLAPCASARVRVTGADGKPASGRVRAYLVVRDGDDINVSLQRGTTPEISFWPSMAFGKECDVVPKGVGEYELPNLIPKATYRVHVQDAAGLPQRVSFTAPATGSRDVEIKLQPRPAKPPR